MTRFDVICDFCKEPADFSYTYPKRLDVCKSCGIKREKAKDMLNDHKHRGIL